MYETFTEDQLRSSVALSAVCEVGMHEAIEHIDVGRAVLPDGSDFYDRVIVWVKEDMRYLELAWRIFTIEFIAEGRELCCAECFQTYCLDGGQFYKQAADKCTHEVFF